MPYVDGFVLAVPKKKLKAYFAMAKKASKVWKDHGAVEYHEAAGEDLKVKMGVPFTKFAKARKDETIVFAWIVYKNRKHRDQVNKAVMKDKRIHEMCDPKDPPFALSRMTYGGFEIKVSSKN